PLKSTLTTSTSQPKGLQ
ncbi:hypothetical protein VN97_g7687, partial [Penicillium thymicola]